jgi:hypothetical protein
MMSLDEFCATKTKLICNSFDHAIIFRNFDNEKVDQDKGFSLHAYICYISFSNVPNLSHNESYSSLFREYFMHKGPAWEEGAI